MNKLLLLTFLLLGRSLFSQNNYEKEFENIKSYVDNRLEKNSSEILNYVKLSDGRLLLSKTDDPLQEFEDIKFFYKILRKNNKIVFISKSDNLWGGMGDWLDAYDYYFNEEGILVGAEKKQEFFLMDRKCTPQIKYSALYKNVNAPKLLKKEKIMGMNGKLIDLNSEKCKGHKKEILDVINDMEKITFRTLEGFMKAEKIKYYK